MMFEKLIETDPEGIQLRNRRTYFLASGFALIIALSSALVISLFAVDLSLGTDNFEMVELLAPVEMLPEEPKLPEPELAPAQPQNLRLSPPAAAKPPTRQIAMARVDETPRDVPTTVSTVQNTVKERPRSGYYELGKTDTDPVAGVSSGRDTGSTTQGSGLTGLDKIIAKVEDDPEPPPPPVKNDPPPPKKPVTQSMGVINGKAISLPKPVYAAAARAVGAEGQVGIQVLIDENGNVVSATAVSGHPLLRASAEAAARNARFSPTLLSGTPVKIKGMIIYNFSG